MSAFSHPGCHRNSSGAFFLNRRGGDGNNIEDDLAQEITNKLSKNIVKRMGPNKTLSSINKISKAMTGITSIKEQFDKSIGIKNVSAHHTTRDAMDDERAMVEEITKVDPFNATGGRSFKHIQNIKRSPLKYLNVVEFHMWIAKHISEMHT